MLTCRVIHHQHSARAPRRSHWIAASLLPLLAFQALATEQDVKSRPKNSPPVVAAATAPATTAVKPLQTVGVGDMVSVQVYGRPELATTTSVAEDGSISLPLVGPVRIAGQSQTAAAQRVAAAFQSGQYLRNPQVTLLITQSRSQQVSVLGEVRTPGRFVVDGRTSVLDLLALAGGTTERGGDTVFLIRDDGQGQLERQRIDLKGLQSDQVALPSLSLRGGDSIYVPPYEQYYIYGAITSPNMYRLEPSMTVLQAISRSGGLTQFANEKRVEIKRKNPDGTFKTYRAKLTDSVLPDDVIYVKESRF
jgi:polysaccharide biosynthesis/export protein